MKNKNHLLKGYFVFQKIMITNMITKIIDKIYLLFVICYLLFVICICYVFN
jgi:hypothetical protein